MTSNFHYADTQIHYADTQLESDKECSGDEKKYILAM